MASTHVPAAPYCPTEHWGQRGGGDTTSDLNATAKLLSRSKNLLPSVAKAVPISSYVHKTFLWGCSLSLLFVSGPKKANQYWQELPLTYLGTAAKPAASCSWESCHSILPRRSVNTTDSPSPQPRGAGGDMETRQCHVEIVLGTTTSLFASTAALKTSPLSV